MLAIPWPSSESLSEYLKTDRKDIRGVLEELAYAVHSKQKDLNKTADIPEATLLQGLMNIRKDKDLRPQRLTEFLSDRAAIIVPRGNGVYTFPHRTFQEYLAACRLTGEYDYPENIAGLVGKEPGKWREVALLAAAKSARGMMNSIWQLAEVLCGRELATCKVIEPQDLWGAQIAGQALTESANLDKIGDVNLPKLQRVCSWLVHIVSKGELTAKERAIAGNSLAKLGDPRFHGPEKWHFPKDENLGFVEIPEGEFLMGSDKKKDKYAEDYETPQRNLFLNRYYIAKYPVTVAQFKYFCEKAGYEPEYKGSLDGVDNHPVVLVTWHDACAYCDWLTDELKNSEGLSQPLADFIRKGWKVRLPSEAEWEKAARGSDGRIFPWGSKPDPEKANCEETGIGTTSTVGVFPEGASPFKCLDMAGNVYEWTISLWGEDWEKPKFVYPYKSDDGREDLKAGDSVMRILRGGAYYSASRRVRCAFRFRVYPGNWDDFTGFRFALSPDRL